MDPLAAREMSDSIAINQLESEVAISTRQARWAFLITPIAPFYSQ